MKNRTLTTRVAAGHCQVSIPTLKRWIRSGSLAVFRTPGGHRRVALDEFQRFLRAQHMPPYPLGDPGVRVLIADDEPQVIDVLVDFLGEEGRQLTVETATDGYEALIKVGSFKPSVLILDVVMPRLDGIQVCRLLRTTPETRDIVILGITGHQDLIPALMEAGAHGCLTKPLSLVQFRKQMETLLTPRGR